MNAPQQRDFAMYSLYERDLDSLVGSSKLGVANSLVRRSTL
jgi:hypothetical protein